MKILLAIECGGHPFWQRNKYSFVMIDTDKGTAGCLCFYDEYSRRNQNWYFGEVEHYIRPPVCMPNFSPADLASAKYRMEMNFY